VSNEGAIRMMSPSNLFLNYSKGREKSVLKSKLIRLFKENKLDYGIEIKSLDTSADELPYVFYKINRDGKETLIKPMLYPSIDFRTLNKVEYCTSKTYTSNELIKNGNTSSLFKDGYGQKINGVFCSKILPSSVLIKNIQISNATKFSNYFR